MSLIKVGVAFSVLSMLVLNRRLFGRSPLSPHRHQIQKLSLRLLLKRSPLNTLAPASAPMTQAYAL